MTSLPTEAFSSALRILYSRYGYSRYKKNKFEEYDLYAKNKDFLISDSVITITDVGGKLMALKPDVTLSIAKNTRDEPGIRKLYYNENVYRVIKHLKYIAQHQRKGEKNQLLDNGALGHVPGSGFFMLHVHQYQSLFLVFSHYTNLFPRVNGRKIEKSPVLSGGNQPKSIPFLHMYKRSNPFPPNLGQDDGIFLRCWKRIDFITLA